MIVTRIHANRSGTRNQFRPVAKIRDVRAVRSDDTVKFNLRPINLETSGHYWHLGAAP